MLKALFVAASLAIMPNIYAGDASHESLEICVDSGECALRVWIRESSNMVYVTRMQDFEKLQTLWTAAEFYIMAPEDYKEIRGYLPDETLTLPAVNPSAHIMERKGGTPAPKPAPSTPLVQGTVTVTVGGSNQCSPCHTGSMHDIHKEVMKPKKDDK